MSDSNNNASNTNSSQSLLAQVEAEIQKAGRESLKAKVKGLVQKRIEALGNQVVGSTPAEYTAQIKREYEKAVDIVKRQGIKLEQ